MQRADLAHHGLVDAQAARRIQDQHVIVMAAGMVHRAARDVFGLLAGVGRQEVHAHLRRHALQLVNSGRAVDVGGHHQHFLLAGLAAVLRVLPFGQPAGQLAGGGGFTGALQAGHQDDGGRLHSQRQFVGISAQVAAHQGGQFLVDDADQGLARAEAGGHFFTQRFFLHAGDKFTHDGQRHVGFQQRHAHFAQHLLGVGLGQAGFTAQRLDDTRKALS
ncbi:hypothetical protein D3C72_1393010 [compost metagenome]